MADIGDIASCLLISYWNRAAAVLFQLQPTPASDSSTGSRINDAKSSSDKPPKSFLIADILADECRRNDDFISGISVDDRKQLQPPHVPAVVVRPWERHLTSSMSSPAAAESDSEFGDDEHSIPEMKGTYRHSGLPSSDEHFRSVSNMAAMAASMIIGRQMALPQSTCCNVSPLSALYRMTKDNFESAATGQGSPTDYSTEGE